MLSRGKHLDSRIRKDRYLIELASPGQDEALCRQWVLGHRSDAALSRLAPRLLPPLLGHVPLLFPAPPFPLLVDVAGSVGVGLGVAFDAGGLAVVLGRGFLMKSINIDLVVKSPLAKCTFISDISLVSYNI